MPVGCRANRGLGAVQRAHAAQQVRKALEVAGVLELLAAHHRRKAHDLGAALAQPRDVALEPLAIPARTGRCARTRHRRPSGETARPRDARADRSAASAAQCVRHDVQPLIEVGSGVITERRRQIREDAIVIDHERRRQDVAQVPADAEFAVVAIARQPARAQRGEHRLRRELRRLHFGQGDHRLKFERR